MRESPAFAANRGGREVRRPGVRAGGSPRRSARGLSSTTCSPISNRASPAPTPTSCSRSTPSPAACGPRGRSDAVVLHPTGAIRPCGWSWIRTWPSARLPPARNTGSAPKERRHSCRRPTCCGAAHFSWRGGWRATSARTRDWALRAMDGGDRNVAAPSEHRASAWDDTLSVHRNQTPLVTRLQLGHAGLKTRFESVAAASSGNVGLSIFSAPRWARLSSRPARRCIR